jgi:hypothetical protein
MPAWGAQARTPPPVGRGEPRPEEVGGATQLEAPEGNGVSPQGIMGMGPTPAEAARAAVLAKTTARRLNEDSARGRRNRRWPRCREMRPDHAGRDGVKDEANEMAAQIEVDTQ